MIRSIVIVILVVCGAFALTYNFIGYDKAGRYYLGKQKSVRKSVRVGTPYFYGRPGGRGFRGGK